MPCHSKNRLGPEVVEARGARIARRQNKAIRSESRGASQKAEVLFVDKVGVHVGELAMCLLGLEFFEENNTFFGLIHLQKN